MINRKLTLFIAVLLTISSRYSITAQTLPNNIAIVLNEYSASNTTGPADNYGVLSDWVEILNLHTSAVSLNGYYLSNDRNNLYKWKFPSNFRLDVGELKIVWLSGRNESKNGNFHANFTLDQCKGQWLILTPGGGAEPRDSVFVQRTKAGHTRGRVDYSDKGISHWRLYTTNSHLQPNPLTNYYLDYLPKPSIFPTTTNPGSGTTDTLAKTNPGGFFDNGSQILKVKINGIDYDTLNFPCFDIYYTLNGDYPTVANGTRYIDQFTPVLTIDQTSVVRVVAVPSNKTYSNCPAGMLDSFCETNTYFVNPAHQTFDSRFGVVSIALDKSDKNWFNSQGNPPSTTVHVEYYDPKKQMSEGYAILNRPPHESWQTTQRGYYMSIDDRYGFGCNFEGNVFNVEDLGTSPRKVFQTLHMKAGDHESASSYNSTPSATTQGTAMREVLLQSLAVKYKLNVNPLHVKPVIAFVNGAYWGVYNLTEVFDKFYENYYNGQPLDSLDLAYYYNGDASVSYPDGSISTFSNYFRSSVYDPAVTYPLKNSDPNSVYAKIMNNLDKSSFIDYMILNSFSMNSDLWNFNIGFAKGGQPKKPGNKWHYYLWNMPATFNYTATSTNTLTYGGTAVSPCFLETPGGYAVSPKAHNGHGMIFTKLMDGVSANPDFKQDYKIRYQDLLNGPLKCENILKQLKLIDTLYQAEMHCHEDPGCAAGPGLFNTQISNWDSNMVRLTKKIQLKCSSMETAFRNSSCYGLIGPYGISVDVVPAGAGNVMLNTLLLNNFVWRGQYYRNRLSFVAIPTSTNYVFDHWEFKNHTPNNPISSTSVTVDFAQTDDVIAVFTDIQTGVVTGGDGANIPTGFTPNGDGLNDFFRPLGSARYVNEYQMTIWNRWGEEVFRSTDAKSSGWDGTYKGTTAPTGVYAYVITFKDLSGSSKIAKGNVTLTR